MNSSNDPVQELADIAYLPFGTSRLERSRRLVASLSATSEPTNCFAKALLNLSFTCSYGGIFEEGFVAVAQATRLWDERPELFDDTARFLFFMHYKVVAIDLMAIPEVPRDQVERFLDEAEARMMRAGIQLKSMLRARIRWAMLGGSQDFEALVSKWIQTPHDRFSNCYYCHNFNWYAMLLRECGRQEEAFTITEQLIANGLECEHSPLASYEIMRGLHLDLGHPEESARFYRLARAIDRRVSSGLLWYLAASGNIDEFLAEFPRRERNERLDSRLEEFRSIAIAGKMLVTLGHGDRTLDFPDPPARDVAGLADWAYREAKDLAQRFDHRSGTRFLQDRLEKGLEETPWPTRIELSQPDLDTLVDSTGPASAGSPAAPANSSTQPIEPGAIDTTALAAEDVAVVASALTRARGQLAAAESAPTTLIALEFALTALASFYEAGDRDGAADAAVAAWESLVASDPTHSSVPVLALQAFKLAFESSASVPSKSDTIITLVSYLAPGALAEYLKPTLDEAISFDGQMGAMSMEVRAQLFDSFASAGKIRKDLRESIARLKELAAEFTAVGDTANTLKILEMLSEVGETCENEALSQWAATSIEEVRETPADP